ncbi:hypothetical protein ACA910_008257 [Epithemia clementina (nom. ined.)]
MQRRSSRSRKPLEMAFPKRPPPPPMRPSPRKSSPSSLSLSSPSSALSVFVDCDETVGVARRQIFHPNATESEVASTETSLSSPKPPSSYVSPNKHRTANEDTPYPAKKRRGTPKKHSPVVCGGKENADSLDFLPLTAESSSSAAKSLFAPLSLKAQQRKLEATELHTYMTDAQIDPWEVARQLSPEQQRSHYWKLCYGNGNRSNPNSLKASWSAQRAKPNKSCLVSSTDPSSPHNNRGTIVTPSIANLPAVSFATPKSSPQYQSYGGAESRMNHRMVQFGPTRAAEYESNDPALTLTPMPPDEAAMRYPIEMKEETEAETSMLQETKENTALLDEWEGQDDDSSESIGFTLIEQSDDSSEEGAMPSEILRLSNRNRRSSSIFLPAAGSVRLLDEDAYDKSNDNDTDVQTPSSTDSEASMLSPFKHDTSKKRNNDRRKSSLFPPCASSKSLLDKDEEGKESDEHNLKKSEESSFLSPDDTCVRLLAEDSENDERDKSDFSDVSSACTEETATPSDRDRRLGSYALTSMNLPRLSISSPINASNAKTPHCAVTNCTLDTVIVTSPLDDNKLSPLATHQSPNEKAFHNGVQTVQRIARPGFGPKNFMSPYPSKDSISWLDRLTRLHYLARQLGSSTKGENERLEASSIEEIVEDAEQTIQKAESELAKIRSMKVAVSLLSTNLLFDRRVKKRLQNAVHDLEQKVHTAEKQVSLLKQCLLLRMEIKQTERQTQQLSIYQELVPLEIEFLFDDILQVTFAAEASGINYYAPGETLRVLADSSTGIVSDIQMVATAEHNQHHVSVRFSIDTENQNECKHLLERELERLRATEVEMDVSEVVQYMFVFLSRLERHCYSISNSSHCMEHAVTESEN